ncbi:MAG: hypothetical protein WD016_05900 [Balneolaceae bacterium]
MKLSKYLQFSIITLLASLTFFACSTDSTSDSSATINGSVESESTNKVAKARSVEGAVVSAARVTSNGSLETIEGATTETNASGSFSLEVDVKSAQNIVILAEKESQEWKAFLSGKVENGQSYTLKPLNTESSAETKVFSRVVASGNADIVQKADIEAVVSNKNAAAVNSGVLAAGEFASALKNSSQARVEFYMESFQDDAESRLDDTYAFMAEAQFELEADLAASSSTEEEENAHELFLEKTINAYTNAGLEASGAAKSVEMWSRIFVNSFTTVSSETKEDARKNSSLLVAIATDNAVQARAEASAMSESSKEAIVEAGAHLKTSLRASAGAKSEVESAFEEYHNEVRNTMESDTAFEATVILEIDSEINSSSGVKSDFSSSISSVISAATAYDIYSSFYSAINAIVEDKMDASGETEVVAEIMILINLAT